MAKRAKQIIQVAPGILSGGLVGAIILLTMGAVFWRAGNWGALGPGDWAAVRFTLWQAAVSAIISVVLAIPVARALARRSFVGRGPLILLLGAPFILPVIVAVLALLAVFGRNGLISAAFAWVDLGPIQIYGIHGVILAHVFFNLPLATRLILQGWLGIPAERFRLAASLGFSNRQVFRILERPMLAEVLPGALMVIFVICMTSFAVALALGGGPKATTIELAIYQAFRFDFDLGKAALLAVIQLVICAGAALIMIRLYVPSMNGGGLDRTVERWDANTWRTRTLDSVSILLVSLFLIVPLLTVFVRGVPALFELPAGVWPAALRSVVVALGSVCVTIGLVLPLSFSIERCRGRWFSTPLETVGYLAIAVSPLVMGTGLFIMLFPVIDPVSIALPVTAFVNATVSIPFALRILSPEVKSTLASFDRLSSSLGLTGWARLRWVYWPRLRRPLGFSAGLTGALSMGDLGVIALFADPEHATLPLQMFRLMGSYRMTEAAGAAILLFALTILIFWLFDRGGRINADT